MAGEKRRRRVRRKKKMPAPLRMGVLITVLVLVAAAAGIMMAPVFNITEVYCEGCNNVKTEDIIASAQIENGTHILLANIGKARRQVEDNPLVKQASVRRVFPDKICITVEERIPSGYIMRGTECNVTDSEGVVLEVINDGRAEAIAKEYTPESKEKDEKEKNNSEEKDGEQSESDEKKEDNSEENAEENKDENKDENQENTEEINKPYNIPVVAGIECEATEIGAKLKVADEGKFDKTFEILNALRKAQLLERTTYIDVTDMSDIRLVVEKRLDIYIGTGDNIDYRAKFLAEVINTKISSYEKVVMDYRGDDIFVRPPEDGKDRIYKEKSSEDEDENESDKKSDKKTDGGDEDENEEESREEADESSGSDDGENRKSDDDKKADSSDEESEADEEDSAEKLQSNMSLDE